MKRSALISFLALALMQLGTAGTVFGSESRVAALGGRGIWIQDDSNVILFPGTLLAYPDRAISELRMKDPTRNSYTVGVHLGSTEGSVLGVYLNSSMSIPLFPDTDGIGMVSPTDVLTDADFERMLTVYYGMSMSGMHVAGGLTFGIDSYSSDAGTLKLEEKTRYVKLSGGITTLTVDLGMSLDLPGAERKLGSLKYTWSGVGLELAGRAFLGEKDELTIVPVGQFSYSPTKAKFSDDGESVEVALSEMVLFLGVAVHKPLNERNLLVLGLEGIGYHKTRMEEEDPDDVATQSVFTLPGIYLGIESRIRPWLVGRVGAVERFQTIKRTWEYDTVGRRDREVSRRTSDLDVTLGLGIHFGKFMLDAVMNDNLLFDGPNFISGTVQPMSNRLSLTYSFD